MQTERIVSQVIALNLDWFGNKEENMKPTKLRLTSSILEKTPGLKVTPIIDHDPEIYGRVYHQGVLIGHVTYTGRVELLRGQSRHKVLFKILDKAT